MYEKFLKKNSKKRWKFERFLHLLASISIGNSLSQMHSTRIAQNKILIFQGVWGGLTHLFQNFRGFGGVYKSPKAPPGGEHRERPPPKLKKCCRKMMLFPKALFLATTFSKVDKNSIFLLNFYQNFLYISIFSIFVFLVQTRENLTQDF